MTRATYRFRLTVVCLGLATLAFLQDPGATAADTKLDLTQDPWAFLGRALHMWDDNAFFGQLQNQAYGYLWPIGPFFGLMDTLEVAPWVAQRLWWSVLLVTAFLGMVRLSRHLGVDSPTARVSAGLAYALSARIVTELGPVSVESWPMALAPWLVLPLVIGSARGSPRRWAAVSALVVLMAGGINAVATAAVIPVAAVYLLTRSRGPRRRALLGWWVLGVGLASLWWAIPLLLLGRYSPPFLDWIEGARATTLPTDPASILRGTSQWVAHLGSRGSPVWHAGWTLVAAPLVAAATMLVATIGLLGLTRRRLPERTFLTATLLVGLILVGLGHVAAAPWTGAGSAALNSALDGVLAPLRNVHKFQPLVTLPLAVGFAHAVEVTMARAGRLSWRMPVPYRAVAAAGAIGLVAVAAWPALAGALTRDRTFAAIPSYWSDAAAWLTERGPSARALVVPASSFGVYLWGRSQDEPLQVLGTPSWAVRDAVPLSSAGNIRFLDEIERRLGSGRGSVGVERALDRAGVRFLVVRNDLDPSGTTATNPGLVHAALDSMPGTRRVASFGPLLEVPLSTSRAVDGGAALTVPAVEIYELPRGRGSAEGRAVLRDAAVVTRFTGAPESLVDLAEHDLIGGGALVHVGDTIPAGASARTITTDGYRRSEANFGASSNQYSETMSAEQPWRAQRRVHDYELDSSPAGTVAGFEGLAPSASSSGSSPFALRGRSTQAQPWAAVDGDVSTAWVSGALRPGVGQWWQADLDEPTVVRALRIALVTDGRTSPRPTRITVTTDSGSVDRDVDPDRVWNVVATAGPEATSRVRITLAGVEAGGPGGGFGISEVVLPVGADRTVDMGASDGSGPIVMAARTPARESCVPVPEQILCHPALAQPGEERVGLRRVVDLWQPQTYRVVARYRPRPGPELDSRLALPALGLRVEASSQSVKDPAGRGQAAADRDGRTTWIASGTDPEPTLELRWPSRVTVTGLKVTTNPFSPASAPLALDVIDQGVAVRAILDEDGIARFPAIRTRELTVRFASVQRRYASEAFNDRQVPLPVGVSELRPLGTPATTAALGPSSPVTFPCGFAPPLIVDGQEATAMATGGSVGSIVAGRSQGGRSCQSDITLPAGTHTLEMAPSAELLVDSVALIPVAAPRARPAQSPEIVRWAATSRAVEVEQAPYRRTLELAENFNPGWVASVGGTPLEALRVDGWRQAFLVPAGVGGEVSLEYAPDRLYRQGLVVGLLAVAAVLALALVPGGGATAPVRPVNSAQPLLIGAGGWSLLAGGPLAMGVFAGTCVVLWALTRRAGRPRALAAARGAVLGCGVVLAATVALLPWPERTADEVAYTSLSVGLSVMAVAGVTWTCALLGRGGSESTSGSGASRAATS